MPKSSNRLLDNCPGFTTCCAADPAERLRVATALRVTGPCGRLVRAALELNIRNRLHERQGQAVTNFGTRSLGILFDLEKSQLTCPLSRLASPCLRQYPVVIPFLRPK